MNTKIYNLDKTKILTTYDENAGYLKSDRIVIKHHAAVEGVEEVGHYETIKEYPNGGKDVEWIVDTPAVEPQDAWDETEDIYVFVPYTEKELLQRKIDSLKAKLFETDYQAIKYAEGELTISEYSETKEQRRKWRNEINAAETMIAALGD